MSKILRHITLTFQDSDTHEFEQHIISTTKEVDLNLTYDLLPDTGREMFIIKLEQYSHNANMINLVNQGKL